MARRTFDDVTGYILSKLGNRTDATAGLREQWVNDAVLWVANHFDLQETQGLATETLAANSGELTPAVAVDLWWPISVQNVITGQFMEPDQYENVERGTKSNSDQGPSTYCWWKGVFYLKPKSGVSTSCGIKIRYRKRVTRWTTGTSPLPEEYDLILELMAAGFGYEHFRLFDLRDNAHGRARQHAAEMNLPLIEAKRDDYNSTVRPRTTLRWRPR